MRNINFYCGDSELFEKEVLNEQQSGVLGNVCWRKDNGEREGGKEGAEW